MSVVEEFKAHSLMRMTENLSKIAKCLTELDEAEVWLRPNGSSNSVGNLLLHLSGNIRQYIVAGVGGAPDGRRREAEFAATEGLPKARLLEMLSQTVQEAMLVVEQADEALLMASRRIQVYESSCLGHILHVVEHFSYHTGQIAFWVKQLKNKDLGFYSGVDLNQRN